MTPNEKAIEALKILLDARGCLTNGEPEIPEEISGNFDIGLDDARKVIRAFNALRVPVEHDQQGLVEAGDAMAQFIEDKFDDVDLFATAQCVAYWNAAKARSSAGKKGALTDIGIIDAAKMLFSDAHLQHLAAQYSLQLFERPAFVRGMKEAGTLAMNLIDSHLTPTVLPEQGKALSDEEIERIVELPTLYGKGPFATPTKDQFDHACACLRYARDHGYLALPPAQ